MIENEDLVNLPNWLLLKFRIDGGEWFAPACVQMLAYVQELDLKGGVLHRRLRFRDAQGRVTALQSRRIVCMHEPHLAASETTVTAENWSGRIEFRSALDGTVANAGVKRYASLNSCHLEAVETSQPAADVIDLKVRTTQSRLEVAMAARTQMFRRTQALQCERETTQEAALVSQSLSAALEKGESVSVEKVVSLYTTRDRAISECGLEARDAVQRVPSFEALLALHTAAWARLWQRFDIGIEQARRQRQHAHDPAPAHPASAADHLDAQHRPGRGRAGARLAR